MSVLFMTKISVILKTILYLIFKQRKDIFKSTLKENLFSTIQLIFSISFT